MKKQFANFEQWAVSPEFGDYLKNPVENFGMNMLQMMNKGEKKQKDRKVNVLAEPVILKPRPKGLGLGAQLERNKKESFQIGDYVLVKQKPHDGLVGIIIQVGDTYLRVQLHLSGSIVKVQKDKIAKIEQKEALKIEAETTARKNAQNQKKRRLKWVVPHIRVKVIDKTSKLYLKKVIVTELINQREFECIGQEQNGSKIYIKNLKQKDIQTVVPKVGQTVIILQGRHTGEKALIVEKKKQDITVQTVNQLQIIALNEDDLSQYVQL